MKPYILTCSTLSEERNRIQEYLNNSFYPLDEEQPNSGVTEIHYFNNGKWEQL